MRNTRIGIKRAALACGAAGLALAATAPAALAAGHSYYASFDFAGESVTDPAVNFPPTQITTDSTAPSQASGQSAFLNGSTPFAQVFGSSQGKPYALLRSAKGLNPSTTVLHFDRPLVPGSWGFALGDVDAEKVRVNAYDAAGDQVPTSALGFQGSFNYCQGTPLPSSCGGTPSTDEPNWDPGSAYLVGNVADTNGASGWFRPTARITTLELYSVVQTGIPAYQFWLAALDQPPAARKLPAQPPVLTPPGQSVVIPVCSGVSKNIDLISGAEHGKITAHGDCTVTYTPRPGFVGTDTFTLRIETGDGKVLVRSFDVKVARMLPMTGVPSGLGDDAAAAVALLGAGVVLTVATRRARKE
ncbi:hypothetical protein KGQ20_10750 [Catenulispora sp. NF23]|uniref:Uncharacterized protein n=1 Tax=Catenulispora pinistramenti TaxID=2705254 RepID=A0ABS5KUI7_9ACTN|nr:Ig-like domain-containing protein [Catenulispora pinistramenti]MBS2533252.1 hypothetical protein [Catenulispora pinistramenti]MBS2549664.1 hypothetical protein [Catenulispora pinistramenti]